MSVETAMNPSHVVGSQKPAASPEEIFWRQAAMTGCATLMVVIFATCIGVYIDFVAPAFTLYTQSVEYANVVFCYGVLVLGIGARAFYLAWRHFHDYRLDKD